MKKKQIKKLALSLKHELNHLSQLPQEQTDWSDYDEEVSSKFRKMFLSLLEHRTNIRLETNDSLISITSEDVTSIKKSQKSKLYTEENYLRLDITKFGFKINRGFKHLSSFRDDHIYDDLIDIVKKFQQKYNSEVFNYVWSEIMKDSGIVRDNNLDDLLNG